MEHELHGIKVFFASLDFFQSLLFSLPFILILGSLALFPLAAPHFWENNKNKALVSISLSMPIAIFFVAREWHVLAHTLLDYVAFIALLGALFIISGGIYIRGAFAGLPAVNTFFLLIGALLANFIGTTGASMLLIRPLLRANKIRHHKTHIVIFFIFVVSNCAGLLTPLGDPPLFLGFLKGIDFTWTLRLGWEWAIVNLSLLFFFYLFDHHYFKQEHLETKKILKRNDGYLSERFGIEGRRNFLLLILVIGLILFSGYIVYPMKGAPILGEPFGAVASRVIQSIGMIILAVLSYRMTTPAIHHRNHFSFGPIIEVAVLFIGIFIAMIPTLMILETKGSHLGINHAWQFFWMTGTLSSFLDNAPTYLTFTSLAKGALNLPGEGLAGLMHDPHGEFYLKAIACGAVFMGAMTYIGNGPNFMVKAIAEEAHIKMPSFFGYMKWSVAILLPLFVLVTVIFFR
jgi:Na+/H+ antiporter NhaD/arsenite permease-like protein